MPNHYLNRLAKKGLNSHGKIAEKRIAKHMGARLHPNSGAMAGAKSDASLKGFRMEMKTTTGMTMKIERGWLAKIIKEALPHGQQPAVVIAFVDESGRAHLSQYEEWVLIPRTVFEELV